MSLSSNGARFLGLFVTISLALPATCQAATPMPYWVTATQAAPTAFHPGDTSDFYEVVAVNNGGADTSGPITVTDTLPAGLTVNNKKARAEIGPSDTATKPFTSECEEASSATGKGPVVTVTCTTVASVPIGRSVYLNINVNVPNGEEASSLTNVAAVTGGGAPVGQRTTITPVTNAGVPVPFGVSLVSDISEVGGVDTQAGSHPLAFTTLVSFNVAAVNPNEHCNSGGTPSCAELNAEPKDLEVALPAGLYGNPTAVPYCTQAQFEQASFYGCPASSQVGAMYLRFYGGGTANQYAPVYNIEPPPGQPAELGFSVASLAHIPMFFHVRSDGDYGLTASLAGINTFDAPRMAILSIWGNPSDSIHDPLRLSELGCAGFMGCPSGVLSPKPFLTLPSDCAAGATTIDVAGDSWQESEQAPFARLTEASVPVMTGCEDLAINPSLTVTASSAQASAPAGYSVHLHVPQREVLGTLGTPPVRDVAVTLPQGTMISPASANGLAACSEAQFQKTSRAKGACPDSSKVGTVTVTTPLLAAPLKGSMFVAEPECSPCSPEQAAAGQLVHLYLEAHGSGVAIKLAGHTRIDQATGQLTTVFTDNPQLPFSDLTVTLDQGPNASLVNPATCGPALATAAITPWSSTSATDITAPPVSVEGCLPPVFAPSLIAGTTSARAGAFTGFHVTLTREDTDQPFGRVSVTTPPGLLGLLKSVPRCAAAQAGDGTCPESSLIGTGFIVSGPGSEPLTVGGTKVYLTGPYRGAPFGLSIVNPTQAGPFVLAGNTGHGSEVVRAAISVDPHTGQVAVTSDPLPQALDGVPLEVRRIDLDINRAGFMFNPTDCNANAIHGVITDAASLATAVSYPFQAHDCGLLPFKPTFKVSTGGHASKTNGVSLDVKVTSHGGPQPGGGEANIAKVKVSLPKTMPSRQETLNMACLATVFESNPSACPAAANVGTATVSTPVLASPLSGPAILVSHGGASFPDLDIVLQGEGVTLILVGNTFISKSGITTSTFNTLPDAPISSFELKLPTGRFSILGANAPGPNRFNLCGQTLNMPTTITGQNGAVITRTTKIATSGCAKARKGRAQKLAAALKACNGNARPGVRATCAQTARRRYERGHQQSRRAR